MKKKPIDRRSIGTSGEQEAVRFLKHNGCCIIETQFHSRYGEIDIIARDGNCLCFVEVKTRKHASVDTAAQSISCHKQTKLKTTAEIYLAAHDIRLYSECRFDVILLTTPPRASTSTITWLKNAFS